MMNKKNLKSLRNDKRAVSPVIGVILMVAITVILAAVIGAFVFGFGTPAKVPIVSFKVTNDGSTAAFNDVVVEVTSGELILQADYNKVVWNIVDAQPAWGPGTADIFAGTVFQWASTSATAAAGTYRVKILHVPSHTIILDTTVATS